MVKAGRANSAAPGFVTKCDVITATLINQSLAAKDIPLRLRALSGKPPASWLQNPDIFFSRVPVDTTPGRPTRKGRGKGKKAARAARISSKEVDSVSEGDTLSEGEDSGVCQICMKTGDQKKLLLCDGIAEDGKGSCDAGYHYDCVGLSGIPEGNWYCPKCEAKREKEAGEKSKDTGMPTGDQSAVPQHQEAPSVAEELDGGRSSVGHTSAGELLSPGIDGESLGPGEMHSPDSMLARPGTPSPEVPPNDKDHDVETGTVEGDSPMVDLTAARVLGEGDPPVAAEAINSSQTESKDVQNNAPMDVEAGSSEQAQGEKAAAKAKAKAAGGKAKAKQVAEPKSKPEDTGGEVFGKFPRPRSPSVQGARAPKRGRKAQAIKETRTEDPAAPNAGAVAKEEITSIVSPEAGQPCIICGEVGDQRELLLCDSLVGNLGERCDIGCHASCLGLTVLPDGEWNCPTCINARNAEVAAAVVRTQRGSRRGALSVGPGSPGSPYSDMEAETVASLAPESPAPLAPQSPGAFSVRSGGGGGRGRGLGRAAGRSQATKGAGRSGPALSPASPSPTSQQVCVECKEIGDQTQLLLCDGVLEDGKKCDAGYHTYCVGLDSVPEGEWFCSTCSSKRTEEFKDTGRGRGTGARRAPIRTVGAQTRTTYCSVCNTVGDKTKLVYCPVSGCGIGQHTYCCGLFDIPESGFLYCPAHKSLAPPSPELSRLSRVN
mmetsp:Transcript_35019/g.63620  ORF Transcript_35019/g.63620 Transcript_35019/m.63620 type:complete len:716 (-) Transcript_35019:211-2358(-)